MQCILMNKNTEVLTAEYDSELKVFNKIYNINNISYAPLIIEKEYKKSNNIKNVLSEWFKNRGIPSWRDDLDILLSRLNINSPNELLDKAFGLSLSDQYWIKEYGSNIKYEDINFFEHDFSSADFTNITFSNNLDSSKKISLISPNNTTDGRLKKTWIIDKGIRYLLKGGYRNEVMQPFNEVLASMISKRLGFIHTEYTISMVGDKIVSKCPCFINKDTELIPASQILHNIKDKTNAYLEYIKILEDKGITDAREKIENMFILDYLILNEDRHLNNFGIIRDVNTLKWLDIAPIYDNGQSLNILDYNDDDVFINGEGRFFYNIDNFDNIIKNIKDLKRFDLKKLDGIVDDFDQLLHKYSHITKMTDRRINKICTLLNSRINKLKHMMNIYNEDL